MNEKKIILTLAIISLEFLIFLENSFLLNYLYFLNKNF